MMNEDTTASTSSSGGVKKFFQRLSQVSGPHKYSTYNALQY